MAEEENSIEQDEELPIEDPNPVVPDEEVEDAEASEELVEDDEEEREEEEPPPPVDCPKCKSGAPAWMATFADMATLLMAFFVLIFCTTLMDLDHLFVSNKYLALLV